MTIKTFVSLVQLICLSLLLYLNLKRIFGKGKNKDVEINKSNNQIIEAEVKEKEE